ncbi:MAG: helicase [Methyloglobulus sp.]|nr:helicase [Methyloglobulus sp.]
MTETTKTGAYLEINGHLVAEVADDVLDTVLEPEEAGNHQIPLAQFIQEFGEGLMAAVAEQNPPIYDGSPNPHWEAVMDGLKRQPFPAQRERVQAVSKLLLEGGDAAAVLNGEMGCGKTMMGIAAAAVMYTHGYRRTLVIAPPHLVYKWRREIMETIDNAKVWVLNGPDTLRQLLKIRAQQQINVQVQPEFFILGRVRMRMGFDWRPSAVKRNLGFREFDDEGDGYTTKREIAACPDCGSSILNEDDELFAFWQFIRETERRKACKDCGSQLWTLIRNGNQMNRDEIIRTALCKIPTIGPKTADKLVNGFGTEVLGNMLDDNVFEFINLMDDQGDLVFSDRQAKRMEAALAKQEFSFGQGGYQASEFIKRYLPDGFFDLLLVDEGHEYKAQGSAQGQAMGVLAGKSRKTILLTGTLMGGYADDLFHLLWRIMPKQMIADGFQYNASNSLGSAAMAFMRKHGILKDVYKESSSGNHRTAKGKRMEVQTSKAPGFGPKGVARYVLPFTAFLKLSQIGGNVLPSYDEDFSNIPMTEDQKQRYETLSRDLQRELKEALRKRDKTLLGVVLSALLAWPDTCFRDWEILHPRTRDRLFYSPSIFGDDEPHPKEEHLIQLCKENKAEGRKVLVYTVYSGKHDTQTRLKTLLEREGFKIAVLRSSVSTESREDWILEQVDRGIDILVCNPELVKTGLDLLDFPTICFMQTGYSVYTVQQASRRSWRIGQKQPVRVHYLGYAETAQISCLELMAKKIAVSQSTSGDMPDTGLDVLNSDGDSIEVALAKQLLGKSESILKPALPVKTKPFAVATGENTGPEAANASPGRLDSDGLKAELANYHGTDQWYRHMLVRDMLYTDGVQCFAENGGSQGAYWFIDIIATEYWRLLTKQPFMVIVLSVSDNSTAVITVDDGNGRIITTKQIHYTDMQPGDWKFFLTDNVLLLPGEY